MSPEQIIERMRYMGRQYAAGQSARGGSTGRHYLEDAADIMEQQAAEIARQQQVIAEVNSRCDHLGMRLGEVIAERDALRVDAERYRWLRDADWGSFTHSVVWSALTTCPDTPDELDAAIDAARAAREST